MVEKSKKTPFYFLKKYVIISTKLLFWGEIMNDKYEKKFYINVNENITVQFYNTEDYMPEGEHTHDFLEIVYIESGSGVHKIDNVEYFVKKGDILFINIGQVHYFESIDDMHLMNILIDPKFISEELMDSETFMELFKYSMFMEFDHEDMSESQTVHFKGKEVEEIDFIMKMLFREYERKAIGYKSVLKGGIRILFSKILRKICSKETHSDKMSNELFLEIINHINENFNHKLSLSQLAAEYFYNPAYFGNMLKKYCGKNFSTYLKEKRITEAARLIREEGLTVDKVMEKVGYSDRKFFYSHFKEIMGTTPGRYSGVKDDI